MKTLLSIYRWLCIDIVAGTLASALMAARVCNVRLPFAWYYLLPASVWLIYLGDHLYDSMSNTNNGKTDRNLFYSKNRKALVCLMAVIFLSSLVVLAIWFNLQLFLFGCAMLVLSGIYFLLYILNHRQKLAWYPKEMLIALVYSASIWGFPLLESGGYKCKPPMLIFMFFFLLVFSNTLIFSQYEHESDSKTGSFSMSVVFGQRNIVRWNNFLLSLVVLGSVTGMLAAQGKTLRDAFIVLMPMTLILVVVNNMRTYFSRNDRYGYVTDAAFLLPFLWLLFE